MEIRKLSVGSDYISNSMNYIVGQGVLDGSYKIAHIIQEDNTGDVLIWIINKKEEVVLWKKFTSPLPLSIEYNINF